MLERSRVPHSLGGKRLRTRRLTNSCWTMTRRSGHRWFVAQLLTVRSEDARRAVCAQIKNRETHIDSGQVEDDLSPTKRRLISYMVFREGHGSDTASESFERRLQCSDSDHDNKRGQKVIRAQDSVRIRKVTGKRTTTAATKSSRRGRDREAPKDSGRSCKQGRDKERRRDRGQDVRDGDHKSCDRRERDRTGGDGRGALLCRGSSRNSLGVVVSLQSNMVNSSLLLGHVPLKRL